MADAPSFGNSGGKKLSKNKKILLALTGAGLGVVGILWYRNKQASASSSSADTTDTGDSGIDPNTGIPYADEEGEYGTPGEEGTYDPLTGQYLPGPGTTETYTATNGTWAQEAESYLENLGYDPTTTATAIGNYLNGLPLSQSEYDIVSAALGFFGNPPNGAPSPILEGGGGSGQGSGTGVTVTVPNIVGSRQTTAGVLIRSKGLGFSVSHTGPAGAVGSAWIIKTQSPSSGTKAKVGSTVTATAAAQTPKKTATVKKSSPTKKILPKQG